LIQWIPAWKHLTRQVLIDDADGGRINRLILRRECPPSKQRSPMAAKYSSLTVRVGSCLRTPSVITNSVVVLTVDSGGLFTMAA
jgi:hypothetical protein